MGAASFTFILLCFAGCLSYGSSRRGMRKIIGGSDTAIEDAPYMVKLQVNGHPGGGSIISESWVVTAAHNFGSNPPDIATRTIVCSGGSNDRFYLRSDCTQHTVDNVIIHEEFDTPVPKNNDIAVVHVTSPFTFSSNTSAIRLPSPGASDPAEGKICGWGRNKLLPDGTAIYSSPFQLQCAQVPLVNDCQSYFDNGEITDKMICYGYMRQGSADACKGDSGGPLSNGGTLYGIVSWGRGCSSVKPGVYTRVTQFVGWIKSKTGIN